MIRDYVSILYGVTRWHRPREV